MTLVGPILLLLYYVITDNTVVVFGNPHSKPNAVLEKWSLLLQCYEFPSDTSSAKATWLIFNRAIQCASLAYESEAYIKMLCDNALPSCFSREQLTYVTACDATCVVNRHGGHDQRVHSCPACVVNSNTRCHSQ